MFSKAFIHVQHIVYHPMFTVSCYFPVQIHLSAASLPFSKADSKLCDKQRLQVTRQRAWGREPEAAPAALLGKQPRLVHALQLPSIQGHHQLKTNDEKNFPAEKNLLFLFSHLFWIESKCSWRQFPRTEQTSLSTQENYSQLSTASINTTWKAHFCDMIFSVPTLQYSGVLQEQKRHPDPFCYRFWGICTKNRRRMSYLQWHHRKLLNSPSCISILRVDKKIAFILPTHHKNHWNLILCFG